MAKATVLKITEAVPTLYEDTSVAPARLRITVVGIKPLMTHNPESMNVSADAKRGTRIPEPEVEAEAGTYRMADGTCAIKGEAFRGSILIASSAWKIKRSTMRSQLAHIIVVEDLVPLMRHDGTPIKDYVIDRRRAIVQKQGIIRSRPRFDEWMAQFTVEYDPVLVREPKQIADISADAGNRIGVGDYRPGRNGPMGRFKVRDYLLV